MFYNVQRVLKLTLHVLSLMHIRHRRRVLRAAPTLEDIHSYVREFTALKAPQATQRSAHLKKLEDNKR